MIPSKAFTECNKIEEKRDTNKIYNLLYDNVRLILEDSLTFDILKEKIINNEFLPMQLLAHLTIGRSRAELVFTGIDKDNVVLQIQSYNDLGETNKSDFEFNSDFSEDFIKRSLLRSISKL